MIIDTEFGVGDIVFGIYPCVNYWEIREVTIKSICIPPDQAIDKCSPDDKEKGESLSFLCSDHKCYSKMNIFYTFEDAVKAIGKEHDILISAGILNVYINE